MPNVPIPSIRCPTCAENKGSPQLAIKSPLGKFLSFCGFFATLHFRVERHRPKRSLSSCIPVQFNLKLLITRTHARTCTHCGRRSQNAGCAFRRRYRKPFGMESENGNDGRVFSAGECARRRPTMWCDECVDIEKRKKAIR